MTDIGEYGFAMCSLACTASSVTICGLRVSTAASGPLPFVDCRMVEIGKEAAAATYEKTETLKNRARRGRWYSGACKTGGIFPTRARESSIFDDNPCPNRWSRDHTNGGSRARLTRMVRVALRSVGLCQFMVVYLQKVGSFEVELWVRVLR